MAFIQGHECDSTECGKIEKMPPGANPDELPAGWIKVILPGTTRDSEQDRERVFCCGGCLALFAMERDEAERMAA